jgi:hypothetical protein
MNQFLRPIISEIRKWASTEYAELRADPRSWANSRLVAIVSYVERRAKALFTLHHLKRFIAEMIFGLIRAALIGVLIFVVLRLNFPEEINTFVLSFKAATQRDVHDLHQYMESYQDYLNQKNDASGRYLTKEQELFNDIVQRVFPTKWNSGLITITESQTGGLNNGAVVICSFIFCTVGGCSF